MKLFQKLIYKRQSFCKIYKNDKVQITRYINNILKKYTFSTLYKSHLLKKQFL